MLADARDLHSNAVIIDATLSENGRIVFKVYVYPGETVLEARAQALIKKKAMKNWILSCKGGTAKFAISSDNGIPPYIRKYGTKLPPLD